MSSWMKLESTRSHQVAIAGQVSDQETGLTIGNAIVEITAMPEKFQTKRSLEALQYGSEWETLSKRCDRTMTAPDGFFYFTDLPPGEYTLTAFLPGAATRYKQAQTTVTFPPLPKAGRFHSPKNEDFGRGSAPVPTPPTDEKSVISEIGAGTGAPPLQENETALPPKDTQNSPKFALANLTLYPSGIRGKVTDLQNVAIGRVNVKIRGSGESTTTDAKGNYQLIGLEAPKTEGDQRQVKVVFSAKGYGELIKDLQFSLGEVIEPTFQLTKQNSTVLKNGTDVNKNNTS